MSLLALKQLKHNLEEDGTSVVLTLNRMTVEQSRDYRAAIMEVSNLLKQRGNVLEVDPQGAVEFGVQAGEINENCQIKMLEDAFISMEGESGDRESVLAELTKLPWVIESVGKALLIDAGLNKKEKETDVPL